MNEREGEGERRRAHAQMLSEFFRAAMFQNFQTRASRPRQRGTKAGSDSELGCIVSAHESIAQGKEEAQMEVDVLVWTSSL